MAQRKDSENFEGKAVDTHRDCSLKLIRNDDLVFVVVTFGCCRNNDDDADI